MANPKGNLSTLKSYSPAWKGGKTRTIRVPIALSDKVLEYAHKLDEGDEMVVLSRKEVESKLLEATNILEDVLLGKSERLTKDRRAKIDKVTLILDALTQAVQGTK